MFMIAWRYSTGASIWPKFLAFTDRERHPIEMASALSLRKAVKPTVESEFPNTARLICPWPPRESTALTGAPGAAGSATLGYADNCPDPEGYSRGSIMAGKSRALSARRRE
jgi:hypothetical protein